MKKTLNKYKIMVLVILAIMCLSASQISYATGGESSGLDFSMADDFIEQGKNSEDGLTDLSTIGAEFTKIGNLLTYIGAGVLVGATGYMGILYIVSAPEKQAKLKQQLVGLVVSAVVIFGAYGIWKMIVTVLENTMG